MSRSRIIRDLSLLVSWFEGANPSTCHTHQVCVEVTKVIVKLLNDTLDYPTGGQMADGPQPAQAIALPQPAMIDCGVLPIHLGCP
jgi:hypothetical protein